jgi:hypothetical protein
MVPRAATPGRVPPGVAEHGGRAAAGTGRCRPAPRSRNPGPSGRGGHGTDGGADLAGGADHAEQGTGVVADAGRRDEPAEAEPRAGIGAIAAARGEGHAGQAAAGGGREAGREQGRLRCPLCLWTHGYSLPGQRCEDCDTQGDGEPPS